MPVFALHRHLQCRHLAAAGLVAGQDVVPGWGWMEWAFVTASAVLHVAYFVVLLRGYRVADLTVVYPLARGSGPLISSLVAVMFWGTDFNAGAAGIAGVVLGCS
jgi:multidrug transporter EmrE-like cation transporter